MVMGREDGGFDSQLLTRIGATPVQIEKADFNGDTRPDLAILSVGVVGDYAQTLSVLLNDGSGGFLTPFVTALQTIDPRARFTVAELNGDGRPDLALLEPGQAKLRVAINGGPSPLVFSESASALVIAANARQIAAGDVTGDGNDDIVLAFGIGGDADRVTIFAADGAGVVTEGASAAIAGAPSCLAVAPIDGDAAADIALGAALSATSTDACLVPGGAGGTLGDAVLRPLVGATADVAVGDLNADGLRDLVYAQPDDGLLSTFLVREAGEPTGFFTRGDSNGDERLDISDAVTALTYIFGGADVDCLEALDANDDFALNIGDPIYVLSYLFASGPEPPAPFPAAGPDPAGETLGCQR